MTTRDLSFEVQTFTGIGKKVVRVQPILGPILLLFETEVHKGYVGLKALDNTGGDFWFGANQGQTYKGTRLLFPGAKAVVAFQVECGVGWSLGVRPIRQATLWETPVITGRGDAVLRFANPVSEFTTITMSVSSRGNSTVYGLGSGSPDLLFSRIGAAEEEAGLPMGTEVVAIETDSAWKLKRE